MMKRRRSSSRSSLNVHGRTTPSSLARKNHAQNLKENSNNDNDDMVRLYRAELTLLQHQRRVPPPTYLPMTPATTTTSIIDETELKQPSSGKVYFHAREILSTSRPSFATVQDFAETILAINNTALLMEDGNSSDGAILPDIPDEVYRLLPVVSGVEFLQVELNSSCWNEDRTIQSTSFQLNGSFLLQNSNQSNNNRKEPFSVCLDLEHHHLQASDDPMSSSSLSFLDTNSGCRIVRLYNCSIGNHDDSNQLDKATILWTQDEMNPFTNTFHKNDDNNQSLEMGNIAPTNNFPIWLRKAQNFVEFAHARASSIQEWQHTYPALFGAVLTDDNSVTIKSSSKAAKTNRPDCLHLWIPARQPAIHANSRTKASSQASASSSTLAVQTAPTAFIVQWSWFVNSGKDFVQVLSDGATNQFTKESKSPFNRRLVEKKRLGSTQHQRKQGEKQQKLPEAITVSRQMQEGLQHLVQYTGGDCRRALEMLLETLTKKHEPS